MGDTSNNPEYYSLLPLVYSMNKVPFISHIHLSRHFMKQIVGQGMLLVACLQCKNYVLFEYFVWFLNVPIKSTH